MAQETINTGSALGDRTGDNGREAFRKVNDNFTQLFLGGFHPQTAAELSAGVTPTSYQYEPGDVRRYGIANDGITTGNVAKFLALLAGIKNITFPAGDYLWDADGTSATGYNGVRIVFEAGARLIASANNRIFFKSTTNAFNARFFDPWFDGNGFTGVVCFDMTNHRAYSQVLNPYFVEVAQGYVARSGCYGLQIINPSSEICAAPIQLIANNSALQIVSPNFDNEVAHSGSGAGIGVEVQAGSGDNIGVLVLGGYIQGFASGVSDAAIGTIVDSVYFEDCSTADVNASAARGSRYSQNVHYGASGAAAYKAVNSDAIRIKQPQMASGARTGLLNFDNTNTNCVAEVPGSNASLNTPLGTVTGILLTDYTISFTVTDASSDALTFTQNQTAYRSHAGLTVTIVCDISFPVTAGTQPAAIALPIAAKTGAVVTGCCGFTDFGAPLFLNGSGSSVNVYNGAGAALLNSNLSGKRLAFTLTYVAQ